MRLTDEQQAIEHRAGALEGAESLKVIAYAGTGKPTTLRAVADSRSGRGVYLAFNRSIAQEATGKLRTSGAWASTMHALALRAVRDRYGGITLKNTNAFMDPPGVKTQKPPNQGLTTLHSLRHSSH